MCSLCPTVLFPKTQAKLKSSSLKSVPYEDTFHLSLSAVGINVDIKVGYMGKAYV